MRGSASSCPALLSGVRSGSPLSLRLPFLLLSVLPLLLRSHRGRPLRQLYSLTFQFLLRGGGAIYQYQKAVSVTPSYCLRFFVSEVGVSIGRIGMKTLSLLFSAIIIAFYLFPPRVRFGSAAKVLNLLRNYSQAYYLAAFAIWQLRLNNACFLLQLIQQY